MRQLLFVAAVAALCVRGAAGDWDDDDSCFNDNNVYVRSGDCPHNCCDGAHCGSKSECLTGAIIGIIVGSILCCCCILGIIALVYYCNRRNYDAQPQTAVVISAPYGEPQTNPQPQPAYGIPVDANGNPIPTHQGGNNPYAQPAPGCQPANNGCAPGQYP